MQFNTDRNPLMRALAHVTGIVERRNTIPILSNILLHAGEETVTLRATDLDMEAIETIPAKVEQAGAATIQAHTLHDIIRKLSDDTTISFEHRAEKGRMRVAAGRSNFELAVLPADDFPDIGQTDLPIQFALPAAELKRLFEKARFAISTEETRYYLNGIYFHAVEGRALRAVATDGHRLARIETDLPDGAAGMPGIIVPRKAVSEVVKLLDKADAPVEISLSTVKIRFAVNGVTLTSKLIDGSFPDYNRVIPTGNSKHLHLDNAELMKAVDRVSTLSSEKGRAVKLNAGGEKLVVSANNPEVGSAVEEISADYTGDALEIGFNARYLLDISAQIAGERAVYKLADASSPTVISDEADATALYVLMPMRV